MYVNVTYLVLVYLLKLQVMVTVMVFWLIILTMEVTVKQL